VSSLEVPSRQSTCWSGPRVVSAARRVRNGYDRRQFESRLNAFDLGLAGEPPRTGWNVHAYGRCMGGIDAPAGHRRLVAQDGDWDAPVTTHGCTSRRCARWHPPQPLGTRYYNEPARGDRFPSAEQPGLFVQDVRAGPAHVALSLSTPRPGS
jgi:hypothetical protein